MAKVITFMGSEDSGKSSIALTACLYLDTVLSNRRQLGYTPSVLLLDATLDGELSTHCKQDPSLEWGPLTLEDDVLNHTQFCRKAKAKPKHVRKLCDMFDTVVVDTSGAESEQRKVDRLLEATYSVVVVTKPGEDASVVEYHLKRARHANPEAFLEHIVVNWYDKSNYADQRRLQEIRELVSFDGLDVDKYVSALPDVAYDPDTADVFLINFWRRRKLPLIRRLVESEPTMNPQQVRVIATPYFHQHRI